MSQFSNKDYDADKYANFRPTYPIVFYDKLKNYHNGKGNLVIDCGCGPGTATLQLSKELAFKKTIGTDLSMIMIEKANQKLQESKLANDIEFVVSEGDDFKFLKDNFNKHNVDMITAAECVHWIGWDNFQQAAWNNLRKNGSLAIWGYVDPIVVGYPKLGEIILDYFYSDDKLGPYWQQPGRNILRSLMKNSQWDTTKFTEIENMILDTKEYGKGIHDDRLYLSNTVTIVALKNYLSTSSSYQSWKKKNLTSKDICEQFFEEILLTYPSLTPDSKVKIIFNSFYKFARAK
ncbi:hypothetical protein TBLA_0C01350 [Henningerozyma blattae CBS 6284]|uniref:Methyltransferase domain-containing protein n=1 Tax=Henningerozyma blattae (strain ATCC 34711 / CBS 6284 / DSM 70876 / NBRC 10599 / NRRL Y-10934 / UCD 77-7) TaxID=1071380 RepID=I2H0P8_HENB6|nr:hypothetical protein TBLA_0C01350 [Tetrapisispora blattae CBS 6284]CCH59950.1 hypothetical protein TBLA_0C01350 [Tetrapisispora blattae CBS 6284]